MIRSAGWLETGLSASPDKFILDVEMLQIMAEVMTRMLWRGERARAARLAEQLSAGGVRASCPRRPRGVTGCAADMRSHLNDAFNGHMPGGTVFRAIIP